MTFEVRFEAHRGYAVTLQNHTSIELLDQTRALFDVPEFSAERVRPVKEMIQNLTVSLSERQARASGLFQTTSKVFVKVNTGALNKFGILKKYFLTDRKPDGGYDYIRAEWSVDEESLLESWFMAGFPLDWTSEEE